MTWFLRVNSKRPALQTKEASGLLWSTGAGHSFFYPSLSFSHRIGIPANSRSTSGLIFSRITAPGTLVPSFISAMTLV